jgi:hypothetical protein
MTSADDAARAVMRAYADSLRPPPVADIVARAEHTRDAPHPPRAVHSRSRGRLVLAAASVAAAIAVVAIAAYRPPDRGATAATQPAATQPTASTGMNRMAPACPPGLPLLEGPHNIDGTLSKPIPAQAGQQLTLAAQIPAHAPDRPLLSFMIYLMPSGTGKDVPAVGVPPEKRGKAVSQSPVLRLAPDQQRVAPVLQIPAGLAPGTYDVVGYATFGGPSLCGVPNPADSPQVEVGRMWGVLGSVVIN